MRKAFSISAFRKCISICLLFIFNYTPGLLAQSITNYAFSASQGTFTPLVSGTTNPGQGTVDDGAWNTNDIGFEFWYMGRRYTTISASTNGWLAFGTEISSYGLVNSLASTATANATTIRPVIAPLWDDLSVGNVSDFSYQTSGPAGSRVFTAQYLNVEWQYAANSACISFQVKLYEGTGKIEFIYRAEFSALSSPSASIGITGNVSGSYLSLNGTGTNPGVSSTTETTDLNTKPASGQVYTFTPIVPADPSGLNFTNITSSAMTLNWTDNATNETGFSIYRSDDNGLTYEFVTQTAANEVSYTSSGLFSGTTYFWKVYAVSEGALSKNPASGSQSTNVCESSVTTRTWIGAGNGGSGTIFEEASNWNPAGTPSCADSLSIALTSSANISLGSSIEIGAINASISGANKVFTLNTGTHTLQINQTATFNVSSGNGSTQMKINVEDGGSIIYHKKATFAASAGNIFPILGAGGTTGTIQFKGDVTFNARCNTDAAHQPDKVIFDANGMQMITFNHGSNNIVLGKLSTEIGSQHNPTVIIAGSASGTPYGDLNINGTSTLDLSTKTFNRYTSGGSINMATGSTLKLAGDTGGQTGSNFPANFSTYAFDANSTVIYNAANGVNQTIYATPTYQNLILANSSASGSSTKTAAANLGIAGNLTISDAYTIFNAGTSLNHSLQGNWINNGAANSGSFTYTSNTMTFNGTLPQQIQGTAATTFNNLTLNNSGGLTLAPSTGLTTTITNTLALSKGKITLGKYDLAIGADAVSGSISGYSSSNYIITNGSGALNQYNIGTDQRTNVVYPIGSSSSSYTPVTLNVVDATTVDNFKAAVSQGVLTNGTGGTAYTSDIVDRTWHISEGTATGSNVTLTVQWNLADELAGFDRANCYISHYTGDSWIATSTSGAAGAGPPYTRVSGTVTSFSPFTVGGPESALPIALLNFSGRCDGNDVLLAWETASETNNDYFTIEKSNNAGDFAPIGTIAGAGNSTSIKKYSFTDVEANPAVAYYRLKQTDFDGNYKYYIISVNKCNDTPGTEIINTYHDSGILTFNIYSDYAQESDIIVFDATGREVLSSQHYLSKGNNKIKLNAVGLSPGIYLAVLLDEKKLVSRKIMLK